MAPSAVDEPAIVAPAKTYPPAKIFPVKDTKFEDYIEPQTDGRRKALEQSGAAIVIDNGEGPPGPSHHSTTNISTRFLRRPSRLVVRVQA